MTPSEDGPPDDEADDRIAYTYVFPDGTAEHTVVRIVDEDEETEGWTIEVLPISGDIRLTPDLIDPSQSMEWIPDEGPEIDEHKKRIYPAQSSCPRYIGNLSGGLG